MVQNFLIMKSGLYNFLVVNIATLTINNACHVKAFHESSARVLNGSSRCDSNIPGMTTGDVYAENLKILQESSTYKLKYQQKCIEHERFREEYDSKVPFYDELDRKYQQSLMQIDSLNQNTSRLLFVIFYTPI